jgi:hypothetical protein
LISVLREDLGVQKNAAKLAKLDNMDADFSKTGGEEGTRTPSAAEKRAQELAGASKSVEGLKGKSESDKAAYLSKTFDQAANNTGGIPMAGGDAAKRSGFVFKELSPEQAAGLAGRLMIVDDKGNLKGPFSDELRGTKAGGEILAFYKDPRYAKDGTNRLKLDLAEHQQAFCPPSKTIYLDREAVNGWMKDNQISPEQLYEGNPSKNPYLQKLSRHLVPIFVHEATHQRQLAKAVSSGMDYVNIGGTRVPPYQMEMETEAFSMEGSFVTERLLKGGPAYAGDLDSYEKQKAELFLEKGVEGLRLYNHRTYYSQIDSLEGSVAKEFSTAASMAKTLNGLKAKYKAAPETMGEDELEQMRDLRASIDSRFKWYTTVYADSVAAEAKLNAWRKETTDKFYSSRLVRTKAPPEMP